MKALDFNLLDSEGKTHSLSEYLGKWVVLYFYPKDNTPGCTKEACSFRDNFDELKKRKVVVLGVSKDSISSHRKFADKHNLNFPLLSDPDKKVIKAYKAWGKKKFMGKEFEGVLRITYLIDPNGDIVKIYPKVNPQNHVEEILADMGKL